MRVVIATHQRNLQIALLLFLDGEPGLQLVGTASDAVGLRALLRASRPELALLDWELPGYPPTSLLAEAQNLDPQTWLIVLGKDIDTRRCALAAGADSFVLEGDPPEQLLAAIREAESQRTAAQVEISTEAKGE